MCAHVRGKRWPNIATYWEHSPMPSFTWLFHRSQHQNLFVPTSTLYPVYRVSFLQSVHRAHMSHTDEQTNTLCVRCLLSQTFRWCSTRPIIAIFFSLSCLLFNISLLQALVLLSYSLSFFPSVFLSSSSLTVHCVNLSFFECVTVFRQKWGMMMKEQNGYKRNEDNL